MLREYFSSRRVAPLGSFQDGRGRDYSKNPAILGILTKTTPMSSEAVQSLEVAELETERLPLSEVMAHPANARIHTPEQIEAIQESYRLDQYIAGSMCIQKSTRRLYKGHAVYEALSGLGIHSADFVVKDLTDAETLALLARDNALSDMSTNDPVKLKAISVELQKMEVNIERMGYSMKEIDAMQPRREVVEDDPPEVEERVITQMGDLWTLGRHKVLCGDSTRAEDVERVMGGEKASNAFTSPPYAEQRSKQYGGIPVDEYVDWWEKIQENAKSALFDNGSFFLNIKEHCEGGERVLYVKDLVLAMKRRWNWLYIDEFCWQRPGVPMFQPNRFKNGWEPVFHFASESGFKMRHDNVKHPTDDYFQGGGVMEAGSGQSYLPADKTGPRVKGLALPSNVIQVSGRSSTADRGAHPASFPLALPSFFMQAFSDEGDPWFDPFLGSGTTLIAADELDRICFGIEISPAYCDVIVRRYINHSRFDSAGVSVERKGKTMTWGQATRKATLPKVT